jgi:hypothetical protein
MDETQLMQAVVLLQLQLDNALRVIEQIKQTDPEVFNNVDWESLKTEQRIMWN